MPGPAHPGSPRRRRAGVSVPLAVGALLVAASLAAGCAAAAPRPASALGPAPAGPASATAAGVTIRVSLPDSAAAADARGRYVTLRVEVENRSGGPLLLRPGLFRLTAQAARPDGGPGAARTDGGRAAVPLAGISGTRIVPAGPGRYTATDGLDARALEDARRRYREGDLDPLSASFHTRGGLSHFRVVRLPTDRMRDAALPTGPLAEGGSAAGILHFPPDAPGERAEGAGAATARVLAVELSRPDGVRVGRLEIPVAPAASTGPP